MRIRRVGYLVKGFLAVADRALCWSMISADAEQRYRILCFREKHHGIALRTPLDRLADRFGNQSRMYWPITAP